MLHTGKIKLSVVSVRLHEFGTLFWSTLLQFRWNKKVAPFTVRIIAFNLMAYISAELGQIYYSSYTIYACSEHTTLLLRHACFYCPWCYKINRWHIDLLTISQNIRKMLLLMWIFPCIPIQSYRLQRPNRWAIDKKQVLKSEILRLHGSMIMLKNFGRVISMAIKTVRTWQCTFQLE